MSKTKTLEGWLTESLEVIKNRAAELVEMIKSGRPALNRQSFRQVSEVFPHRYGWPEALGVHWSGEGRVTQSRASHCGFWRVEATTLHVRQVHRSNQGANERCVNPDKADSTGVDN